MLAAHDEYEAAPEAGSVRRCPGSRLSGPSPGRRKLAVDGRPRILDARIRSFKDQATGVTRAVVTEREQAKRQTAVVTGTSGQAVRRRCSAESTRRRVHRRLGPPPRLATEDDVASLSRLGWLDDVESPSPRSVTCSTSGRLDMVGPLVGSAARGRPEMMSIACAASDWRALAEMHHGVATDELTALARGDAVDVRLPRCRRVVGGRERHQLVVAGHLMRSRGAARRYAPTARHRT